MWRNLTFPWQAAFEMAWEAACAGCIPIGAVIMDSQGRLAAAGRNRLHEQQIVGANYVAGHRVAHAEINALISLDYSSVNPRECTLYTTTEPCPMCAGAILMSSVRHVCYGSRDPWAGAVHLYTLDPYMSSKHMRVEGPPSPAFEEVLVALQTDYFRIESARRGPGSVIDRDGPFFAKYEAAIPRGVALGDQLHRTGFLAGLRAARTPPDEVIDLLARELEALPAPG